MTEAAPKPAPAADPFAEVNAANIEDIFGEGSWGGDTLSGDGAGNSGDATEFAGGEPTPPAAPASVGAEEGEGGVVPAAPPEPPAPPTPPAPVVEPPVAPSEDKLELESLKAQVAALTAAAAKPADPPAAAPVPAAADDQLAAVKFEMPPQLRDALLGDDQDQFTAGINHLVSGILTTVQNAIIPIQQELAALKASGGGSPSPAPTGDPAPGSVDLDAQAATMREQYFTTFSAHRADEFQPIIAAVASEMAAQYPGHAWNEQYIAAMGTRVTERAKAVAKLMNASNNPAPPSLLQPGARSAAPGPGSVDIADEIEATLGFG